MVDFDLSLQPNSIFEAIHGHSSDMNVLNTNKDNAVAEGKRIVVPRDKA